VGVRRRRALASCPLPSLRRRWRDPAIAIVGTLVVAVAYRPRVGLLADEEWYFLAFPLAIALVYLLTSGQSRVGPLLGTSPLVALGDASYALYLLHDPPMAALRVLTGEHPQPAWVSVGLVALVIGLSLASYRWLDSPARRWLRAHQPALNRRPRTSDAPLVDMANDRPVG
jgi:peptidoglycan/LPS O-acetylase OafA/YrhL